MSKLEHETLVSGEASLQTLNAEQKEYLCTSLFIRIRELYKKINEQSQEKEEKEA